MKLFNWFKKSDYVEPEVSLTDVDDKIALEHGRAVVDEIQFPEPVQDPTEIRESSRRYASNGFDRTFWYDDVNDVMHLSGLGNTHAQLLDEFGDDLGWQGRYSGSTVDWYGMEGFIPLEGQQRAAHALSERFGCTIKTADKMHDFLMNPKSRPDLQTPEAQEWLHSLKTHFHNEKTDKLMPWLTREWKKGRANITRDGYLSFPNPEGGNGFTQNLDHWADWKDSKHPEAQGDLMRHKIHEVAHHVGDWDQQMKDQAHQKALEGGSIVHRYPNGWSVRNLTKPDELRAEGDAMGHCVGGHGYAESVDRGHTIIHSLRDEKNRPHATIEYEPTEHEPHNPDWIYNYVHKHPVMRGVADDPKVVDPLFAYHEYMKTRKPGDGPIPDEILKQQGIYNQLEQEFRRDAGAGVPKLDNAVIKQIQGKGNEVPKKEYQALLKQYFTTMPPEKRPNWDGISDGPIDTFGEFIKHHDLDFDDYQNDYNDYGDMGGYGQHGDYGLHTPDREHNYRAIVPDLIRPKSHYQWSAPDEQKYDPEEGHALYETAKKRGEIPQLADAVQEHDTFAGEDLLDKADQNSHYDEDYAYPGEFEDDQERWDNDPAKHAEAHTRYDDAMEFLASEHQPSVMVNHLHGLINKHYNPATGRYENEVVPKAPEPVVPPVPQTGTLSRMATDWFEPAPMSKLTSTEPEPSVVEVPFVEHKIVEPNTEVIDDLKSQVQSLAEVIAGLTLNTNKEPERKRLVIKRDNEGRIASIEEE